MKIIHAIDGFFFERIGARGFGLMRIAWAFVTLAYLLMQWNDVVFYYGEDGILPRYLEIIQQRTYQRFTILDWVGQPVGVWSAYLLLLGTLFCTLLGRWTRTMTIVSVLLLFSFHERNGAVLGGGDTVLRAVGFLLMISPGIQAFSLDRAREHWVHWKKTGTLLPALTMPIWPWRMLLWQTLVLYGTSLWHKMLGSMWAHGTAVNIALHHVTFSRLPKPVADRLVGFSWFMNYATLVWHAGWLLLLIPKKLTAILPKEVPRIPVKRFLILGGIFFHGGILFLMDAGSFSLAMFTVYLGLLRDEDFSWIKKLLNRRSTFDIPVRARLGRGGQRSITVLFDGHCGLCKHSVFTLQLFDHLERLRYADFRDAHVRKKEAPDITEKTLDKAMHIKLQDGSYRTGFDAFRYMTRHLPALWIGVPFLYLPGVAPIGRKIYAHIAARRQKCDHESCQF